MALAFPSHGRMIVSWRLMVLGAASLISPYMFLSNLIAASVPLQAEPVWADAPLPFAEYITNSIVTTVIVILLVLAFARGATRHMQMVPGTRQNLFEALVEGLYTLLEGIVGNNMIRKTFGFLASIFIFLLASNWFGLLPGVGSVGWGPSDGAFLTVSTVEEPLLRPGSADLNMTLGLATVSMILWFVWSVQEVGFVGLIKHIFAPKGGMTGILGMVLVPVFLVVGLFELISISTRLISLSLRLFGNIYAGENILGMMINIGRDFGLGPAASAIISVIVPIPFYILELGVGALQAFVFMLLCAVYIQLSTSHDEEEEAH